MLQPDAKNLVPYAFSGHEEEYDNSLSGLCEIVTSANRPLCVALPEDILKQRLFHRSVHILAREETGKYVLGSQNGLGFTLSSMLPAGSCASDCQKAMLAQYDIYSFAISKTIKWDPCQENSRSFATIAIISLARSCAAHFPAKNFMQADLTEILALYGMGYECEPFFQLVIKSMAGDLFDNMTGWLNK